MESVPSERRPLTVAISSNAGSLPMVASNDDFDWLGELLCKGVDDGLVSEDSDDVVVVGEFSPDVKSRKRKLEDNGSDDECLVLDGDSEKLASVRCNEGNGGGSESDDLLVVGETGQIACRDYPHSRHDCIKFPFDTTPHVEHCDLCHCYVCDLPAPCIYWDTGVPNSDHCNASDKAGDWKDRRTDFKLGKSAGQNNLSKDCGTLLNMVPLPEQNIHLGNAQSAANLTPQNPVSQEVMTYQSGQATLPVNTPRSTDPTPQNLVSRPSVYHPSSQTLCYGNTSPANPQNYVARPPVYRRCPSLSSVSYETSNNIRCGIGQRESENLITGLQPLYAPRMVSPGFIVVQPDGGHFRSSVRPQHVSSVARFNEAGIVYRPSASISEYAPNNFYWATPVQFGSTFRKDTVVSAGHDNFLRQNNHPSANFRSGTRIAQFNAPGTSSNAVPSGSSGFSHPIGAIVVGAWTVNPIYQQIQDAGAVDPLDHTGHQNEGNAFQHMVQAIERQQPVQQSNHHLPQDSGLSSVAINDNWWSENELYQGQLPVDPPPAAAAVDIGMLWFDFETSRNGATR